MIGSLISHYRILDKIGEGAVGEVYSAEDVALGRRVAVKLLRLRENEDIHYRARFLREARAVSSLSHPNIATIYDYGEVNGQVYFVMEVIEGRTLQALLQDSALTLSVAVEIIKAVALALLEAHSHGIVHRDIKPSNVIVGEHGRIKVLDFGLAKITTEPQPSDPDADTLLETQTRSGIVVGTPMYLSPEQALGVPIDARSDLFALGALLYECIAGRPAFPGATVLEIAAQIIHINPPPPSAFNPDVPPELDWITMKALAKKPEDRYQSAAEMIAELEEVRTSLGQDARRIPRLLSRERSQRSSALITLSETIRRPRISISALLIMVSAMGLLTFGLMRYGGPMLGSTTGKEVLPTLLKYIAPSSLVILFIALIVTSINTGFGNIKTLMSKWQFLKTSKGSGRINQSHYTTTADPIDNVITFFEAAGYAVRDKKRNDLQVIPTRPIDKENYGSSLVRFLEALPTIEEVQGFCKEALSVPGLSDSGYKPAFLVCPDLEPVHRLQAALYQDMRLAVVPITYDWILDANAHGEQRKNLQSVLEAFVGREDPFRYTNPVSVPGDFYGRKDVTAAVVRDLDRGQSVGLFGMRKIGKTSLIQHTLSTRSGPIIYIDCQGLTHPTTILRRLPKELRRSLKKLLPKAQWPEFDMEATSDLGTLADAVGSYLQDLYKLYTEQTSSTTTITLILDEVDRIVPDANAHASYVEEYESLFGLLRGLGQGLERILVCMVAGFSADITHKDIGLSKGVAGNPVYAFFNAHRLGPMSANDVASMMNGLGSRVRLQFTDAGSYRLYQWSGGHPFLSRLMGSTIHLNMDRYNMKPTGVEGSDAFEVNEATVDRAAEDLLDDVANRPLVAEILERFSDPPYKTIFMKLAHAELEGCTLETLMGLAPDEASRHEIVNALNSLEIAFLIRKENGRFRLFAHLLDALIGRGYV